MKLTLRPGKPEDAAACGVVCFEAFQAISNQHNFPPDIPSAEFAGHFISMLLSHPGFYSVVAERDGKVIGSNFLDERAAVAGVGPITIDPHAQNHGLGKALMIDVLRRADEQGFPAVRLLQAAFHNRSLSLYAKLGFDVREPISNIQGPAIEKQIPGYDVRPAVAADQAACNALCRRIHDHDRAGELADAIGQGDATVVERGGRITGYSTGVSFFGHSVAENNDDLKALISAAPHFAGPGFLLPTRNGELLRWCFDNGLRIMQPLTLMTRGLYSEPKGAFLPSILY